MKISRFEIRNTICKYQSCIACIIKENCNVAEIMGTEINNYYDKIETPNNLYGKEYIEMRIIEHKLKNK